VSIVTSLSTGVYRASERALIVADRFYKPDGKTRGCLYFHGAATTGAPAVLDPQFSDKPNAIAAAGFPVCACDFGDPGQASGTTSLVSFGTDNSITSTASAKTFLQAAQANGQLTGGVGCKTDKFFAYGGSMGSLPLLSYLISLANPASVCAAVALAIPVLDVDDAYQADKGGFRATIGAAYGVTFPTALPAIATHSPVAYNPPDLAKLSMPITIWSASDDPLASPTAQCRTWARKVPNATVVDLGAVGHSGTTVPPADVVAFFRANAA
jgi:pimeloyl-ACP methyl ester carboxylesterase